MSKKRENKSVRCQYFNWILTQRNGVWQADGRSNPTSAGRHSLGVKTRDAAMERLPQLDLARAIDLGLAPGPAPGADEAKALSLAEGRRLYEEHMNRPQIAGGVRPTTNKRYRAVFDKFLEHCEERHVSDWLTVDRRVLVDYATALTEDDYAPRTVALELTLLKQVVKWLVREGHLVGGKEIHLPVEKIGGTDTYCWKPEEVKAIVEYCRSCPELAWLLPILVTLACTGLRIDEVLSLRGTDIDFHTKMLTLTDESSKAKRKGREKRTTKTGRDRTLPLAPAVVAVLAGLPRGNERMFRGPLGGKLKADFVRRAFVRDVLEPLADRFPTPEGQVGFRDGRLHSFRHYFCSTCANTTPEPMLMRWLGHRSSEMVRHYYHLNDQVARQKMNELDFLGGGAGSSGVADK